MKNFKMASAEHGTKHGALPCGGAHVTARAAAHGFDLILWELNFVVDGGGV